MLYVTKQNNATNRYLENALIAKTKKVQQKWLSDVKYVWHGGNLHLSLPNK